MEKVFFTVVGTSHYYGKDLFEVGMEVKLVKDPDNKADREAIKVEIEGLGAVGFVANSPYTVLGESMSAGRIYDRIGDTATGKVKFIVEQGVICELVNQEKNLT